MKKLILPLLIAALALPISAIACPGGGPGKGANDSHFSKMDSNGDGVITAEEHAAAAAKRFTEMDTNGDGKLTRDEIRMQWKKNREQWQKNCPMQNDCPAGKDCPRNQGT